MRMVVISDTHHDLESIRSFLHVINSADYLVHLGDCNDDIDRLRQEIKTPNIIKVRGNCDFASNEPINKIVEINNIKYLFTHGHAFNVNSSLLSLRFYAEENECKYVFYGHTHVPATDYIYSMTFYNPGSTSKPRAGSPKSYAIVEEKDGKVVVVFNRIIEYGIL